MIRHLFSLLLPLLLAAASATGQQYHTTTAGASFKVDAPAKTINGKSNAVSIDINMKQGSVQVKVPVQSFRFTNNFVADTLNQVVRSRFNSYYMESDRFPDVIYTGSFAGKVPLRQKGRPVAFRTEGKLWLHGVAQPVIAEGTLTAGQRAITVKASIRLQPATYGIRIPPYIGDMYFKEVQITVEGVLGAY